MKTNDVCSLSSGMWAIDVLRNTHGAVISFDPAGMILWANAAAGRLFGYESEELVGRPVDILVPERLAERQRQLVDRLATTREAPQQMSTPRRVIGRRRDGSEFVAFGSVSTTSSSKAVFTAVITDVATQTGYARDFDQIGQSLADSSISLLVTNPAGLVTYANRNCLDLVQSGHSGPIVGQPVAELFPGIGDTIRLIRSELRHSARWNGQIELCGRDGTERHLDVWVARTDDRHSSKSGAIVLLLDVTASRLAERALRRSEELLSKAQALTHLGGWEWNILTGELWWTDEVYRIFQIEPDVFSATYEAFLQAVHPDDRDAVAAAVEGAVTEQRIYVFEHRVLRPDGTIRYVEERGEVIVVDGVATGMIGTVHDITEQHERIAAIETSERQMRAVLNAMAARTVVLDARGMITAVNDAWRDFARLCGTSEDIGLGENYLLATENCARLGAIGADVIARGVREVLAGALPRFQTDYPGEGPDGETHWYMVTAEVIDVEAGGAVVSHRDITDRKRAEAELRHLALHDPLTGLSNRQLILDGIQHATRRARSTGLGLAVMLLDLDRFKLVNDTLGHATGDHVLMEVAARISGAVRPSDAVGRLGGDEFIIVCERLGSHGESGLIARRILDALEGPFHVAGRDLYVRASIGIATGDQHSGDAETLMRNADSAMYIAKGKGGSQLAHFDDVVRRRALDRLDIENALYGAIERKELFFEYQPQCSLRTGEVVAYEALARWIHPTRGEISPTDFIPIAEESGLVTEVGRVALAEACRQLSEWDSLYGTSDIRMSVNISTRHLTNPTLIDDIVQSLMQHRLAPHRLELEVTETGFIENFDAICEVLTKISQLGVRIALDDFGTGSGSLSHISHLPLDVLKIDRSFVYGLTQRDAGARAIVTSILAIADAFSIDVVAEGIETEEQLAVLKSFACPVGQGFLLGRPIPGIGFDPRLGAVSRSSVLGR